MNRRGRGKAAQILFRIDLAKDTLQPPDLLVRRHMLRRLIAFTVLRYKILLLFVATEAEIPRLRRTR